MCLGDKGRGQQMGAGWDLIVPIPVGQVRRNKEVDITRYSWRTDWRGPDGGGVRPARRCYSHPGETWRGGARAGVQGKDHWTHDTFWR